MVSNGQDGALEPIAVIGLAFQFPGGANTDDKLWKLMMERRCVSTEFPKDRFNIDLYHVPNETGASKIATRNGHFLANDIREFDPRFFSISQSEAGCMDPQHRAMMETTYHALESAGLTMENMAGSRTSVHVGCFASDHTTIQYGDKQRIAKYSATGSSGGILANRISWFFDLHGPSMTVDTACSSSMVAFDLACKGMWNGNVDVAIVGGVNLIQSPDLGISLSNMSFLSPDGRCYSFDDRGNGYGRGEGVAALLLKPLSRAIQDGNPVRALVRAVGTNQDGHTSGGLTQPSMKMQAALIKETYRNAGLSMAETLFFEAHGTATPVGDPIEARAIGECFRPYRSSKEPIYVGAIKSNVGHLEGCSGLAGIVKAILAVERSVIPPNANFEKLNPQIDDEFFNLRFPTEAVPWPCDPKGIRRASVNSFGFGGTNVHVVLDDVESYMHNSPHTPEQTNGHLLDPTTSTNAHVETDLVPPRLLLLSAADENGCHRLARSLDGFPHIWDDEDDRGVLNDFIYTLNTRRTRLPWRSFAVIQSSSWTKRLEGVISQPRLREDTLLNFAFVFTGQGAQWTGMGRELLSWPGFLESVLKSQACVKQFGCRWSLIDLLSADKSTFSVDNPRYSQLLTTVVQIGLVDLFACIGVQPAVVIGHSSGEIAAAYCAGLINHSSAVKVSYYRGELAAKLAEGDFERHSMLSVGLSVTELEFQMEALKDTEGLFQQNRCTISCINSPSNVTVSAPLKDLDILHSYLTKQGVFVRRLQVGLGYHSAQMRQISPEYVRLLGSLESGSKMERTRMISSVTGCFLEADLATKPTYWDQNMVSQVNFVKAANRCVSGSTQDQSQLRIDQSHLDELVISGIIEIGPHSTLKAPIRQILDGHGQAKEVFYVSALVRDKPAKDTFLGVCGRLFCENVPLNVELLTSWCRTSPIAPKVITQLPRYPFDHSILYWEESRSNRASRLQKYPFNKFLGLPLSMGAVFDTRWRLILRVDEQPWIKDHVINGANVYPGSGMLSMALEAAKQLLCERPPKAFIFQDVEFVAPILLSDAPAGTEVEISLVSIRAEKGLPHYHFRIATWRRDETCEEVCRGSISPDYGRDTSESDLRQRCESPSSICAEHDMAEYTCNQTVDDFYGLLKTKCGAEFGPSFRRLHNISANDEGKAIASLAPYEDDCIVHPVILDAVFQVGQAMARETRMRTMVPRRVGKLWISASGIGHECSSKETVHAQAKMPTRRTAICSISVLHQASRETRLTAEDFEYTVVSEGSDPRGRVPGGDVKHLAAHMIWKPDPSLLATDQLEEYLVQHRDARDDPVEWFREFEVVVLALAARGLSMIENSQLSTLECNSYISWLKKTVASSRCTISQDKLDLLDACIHDENALEALSHRIAMQKAGRLYVEVGQNLTRILTGEVDPLTLIFKDEQLMSDFYDEMLAMSNPLKPVQAYVDVLVHKRPNMKFLEIGAGTGGSTQVMLEVLDTWAGPRYGQYVFTDIGPSFLERGRARFSDKKNMQFRTLNIETDPLHQGFLEHEFDVVVADMVLHATSDLNKTLRHLRKVLKPGGKLIMKEMTTPKKILAGFVFGLLPGWWLSVEECRIEAQSPCIDEAGWDVLLKSNHFSGAEVVVRDYEAEDCHTWSFLFSTATEALQPAYHPERPLSVPHIVTKKGSTLQANLAEKVYDFLELAGAPPKAMSLDEAADSGDLANRDFVILLESEEPILVDPTRELFGSLQKVLYSARSIIWVTQSSCTTSPGYGIITGLARVLRTENNSTQIVTLQLETQETAQIGAHVSSLFKVTQESLKIRCDVESEYLERSNILHINRIVSSTRINEHIFRRTAHPVIHQPIGDSKIRLGIRALGLLDTLEFSEEMSTEQELASDEVLIRVHSIGVNFKDCLTLLGRIDTDDLGSECAGTVVQRGGGCGDISPGARVVVLVLDAYRSFVRTTIDRVTIIPDWMSFAQAASVLTAFCTARFSLIHVARLQKNEKVLIHAAAGGTGQAAVQVSQTVGAEIFVTVGSLAKKQLLVDVYGIPESHIFYSRDSSFSRGIMEATNRQGVDVILNSLAGKLLQASWETIANFGRFVEIGRSDIDARGTLPMYPFRKNASFTGVDLTLVIDEAESDGRQRRGTKLIKEVMDQMEIGSYKPIHPIHEYDIGDIEQALRFLQSGTSSGKVVVNVSQDSVVPVVQGSSSAFRLRPDATYVVCGGLGGLGRSIAKWLCNRGARNLILLSRSGLTAPKALDEVERIRAQGVNVECPICDISNFAALKSALEACSHLPPIKGCFQGAMVLRDSTFARMTFEQWTEAALPKVQGSWNLHRAMMGLDLDFFILLSSAGAIFGNGGQSNYAAGNTFQDALARFRVSRGEKAISLNLGMIAGEGYVAENDVVRERLARMSVFVPIMVEELHAMLDYCCNPELGLLSPDDCQLVTGLMLPAHLRAQGKDVPPQLLLPLFRCLAQIEVRESAGSKNGAGGEDMVAAFREACSVGDAANVAIEMLRIKASKMLGPRMEEIAGDSQLEHHGVDSLVAIELRNWLLKELGADVAVFEILGGIKLHEIGLLVAQRSLLRQQEQ